MEFVNPECRNLQAMVTLPSLLDNDFYKFTMQQCVVKLFPKAKARYKFINRGSHRFPPGFAQALQASVEAMAGLKLSRETLALTHLPLPRPGLS